MQQLKRIPHPSGAEILFDAKWHQYKIGGTALRSVSKLLDKYFPFDEKRVLQLVAKKTGQPVDVIKRGWTRQALLGKNVHEYIECQLLQKPPPSFMLLLKRKEAREAARPADATGPTHTSTSALEDEALHGEESLYLPVADAAVRTILAHYDCLSSEQVIAAPRWGIAGTIDFVGRNKQTNKILIGDWKTSGSVTSNFRFGSFETPCPGCLRHLPNSKFYRYAMQVIIYGRILAREEYFKRKFFDAQLRTALASEVRAATLSSSPAAAEKGVAAKKLRRKAPKGKAGKQDVDEVSAADSNGSAVAMTSADVTTLLDTYYHGDNMEEEFEYGIVQLSKDEDGRVVVEFKAVTPATVLPPDCPDSSFDELLQRVMEGEGV
ncbi:hypothetical protein ABB37_06330 [Leptomonas pyrrhocoris]|uniref:PD-(D/E)XK endonuclease-like domain-containing protein n=1 Tax=Leptomonas pyrrhocoris TaxID=157538 RepID=A0A0M9FXU8_LEPPY|nr:hypothetical protein ABB37_06330 [Leptomonas pyrrhocoris]KPA78157.1 hypothetical protein ABB37_06330 [Leptomonas pyrrhocoris]|eukprot:XP_015656596.1 hypothetical protein ABB37_06330 [Leptomonas pyrrhocoris]